MKKQNADMLSGPLFSSMMLYTIPIILTSLLQLLFNAADLVIVGQFCGGISVGAVGATGSITGLLVGFFLGFSNGAGITVGHALGSREYTEVHNTVHTTLPLAFICGGILTVIGFFSAGTLLQMMGTPENILPLATVYMQIYFVGSTFTIVYNYCASILRASGDTKSPLIFLSISGVLNVVLNVIFVVVLHMDVAGVAWATVISQGLSAFLVVRTLMRRTDACRLELKKLHIYKKQFLKMLRIGLPSGIQSSLFYIANVIIQSSLNSFGDVFITGNSAATSIEGFASAFIGAFQQTSVNFTSQNIGARQYDRVSRILKIGFTSVAVAGLVIGVFFYLTGPTLLSIYIPDSPEAIAYGMVRITYICLPYFICGLMYVSSGALMGTGSSFTPMLISILGICGLRIGWVYTVFQIPQFHTPECLFLSFPVSWTVTLLLQTAVFIRVYRKRLQASRTSLQS